MLLKRVVATNQIKPTCTNNQKVLQITITCSVVSICFNERFSTCWLNPYWNSNNPLVKNGNMQSECLQGINYQMKIYLANTEKSFYSRLLLQLFCWYNQLQLQLLYICFHTHYTKKLLQTQNTSLTRSIWNWSIASSRSRPIGTESM